MNASRTRPAVLLFDVNETLLDIAPLSESVGRTLGDPRLAKLWFTTMLQHSLAMTVAGQFAKLPEIGAATLRMVAASVHRTLSDEDARRALAPMMALPPHPDVVDGLTRLQRAGVRLATLTNSAQSGVETQLAHARLERFFERALSVETIRRYKPDSAVYEWAAREMRAAPGECMLVAAHGWDVAGAKWAGLQTAFIARPGQAQFPLAPAADIEVPDLGALAATFGA